jgi:hypothetical protein
MKDGDIVPMKNIRISFLYKKNQRLPARIRINISNLASPAFRNPEN